MFNRDYCDNCGISFIVAEKSVHLPVFCKLCADRLIEQGYYSLKYKYKDCLLCENYCRDYLSVDSENTICESCYKEEQKRLLEE